MQQSTQNGLVAKLKAKTVKIPEEKRAKLFDISLGNDFFGRTPKHR